MTTRLQYQRVTKPRPAMRLSYPFIHAGDGIYDYGNWRLYPLRLARQWQAAYFESAERAGLPAEIVYLNDMPALELARRLDEWEAGR